MKQYEGSIATTSDKDVITLSKQLLKSHLNVALVAMIFLIALSLLGSWYYSKLKLFSASYWPTTQHFLLLVDGVHRSTAYLHQDISLVSIDHLAAREISWDKIIRPTLSKLNTLVDSLTDGKSSRKQQLVKLSRLLSLLESKQWQIADIALTEGNRPGILMLEREIFTAQQLLLRQIQTLRHALRQQGGLQRSRANERLLLGISDQISACHLLLAVGIYRQRPQMDPDIARCMNKLGIMQVSLIDAAPVFKAMHWALYEEYLRDFDAYQRLTAQVIQINQSKQHNVALFLLLDFVTPLADEIDLLLESISHLYLNELEQELDFIEHMTGYSALTTGAAFILLACIAIILSQSSAQRIGSPVTALAKATQGLCKNTGLTTTPIPAQGVRELRDLISSFNHFRAALIDRDTQLRESKTYYKSIIENSVDPVVVICHQGIIELFNGAACKVFGYTRDETIGQNVSMLVPDSIRSEHDGYIDNYNKTGQAKIIGIGREVVAVRKNGSLFPIYLALSEIRLPSGEIRFAGVIRDQSKQKDMEVELLRAHKLEAVGQLSAGIAHEINTPVQFVSDNITFLSNAFEDISALMALYEQLATRISEKLGTSALLAKIRAQAEEVDLAYLLTEIPSATSQSLEGTQRISVIVRAMKEFSHPGSASKESVDINHAIQTTITVASNEWKYVATVNTDFDLDLPLIQVCISEINQAILNMIVNAAHAITERHERENLSTLGEITISTGQVEDQLEIRISDTGCGMSSDIVEQIFTPFFTTKIVGKGTGQGLAIAYRAIVDNHNGDIKVDSTIGKGTTFIIRLPINGPNAETKEQVE